MEWATHPSEPTSKVKSWTVQLFRLPSAARDSSLLFESCLEYLLDFLVAAFSMFSSKGTVSSPHMTVLVDLE